MTALLAIDWEPELRGILITIIAVVTFCGSVYFILSTNLGARLGFLVAFAALAGWMFLMGAMWWTYGNGLLGPDASWEPVSGQTVLQTTDALNELRRRSTTRSSSTRRRPDRRPPTAVDRPTGRGGLDAARVVGARRSSRPAPPPACCSRSPARWQNGEFQVVNVFDKGGERRPQLLDGKLDFLAFFHKPHYAVVEVAPLVEQRDEPGRAPAKPEIDTTRPHQYVYMIRDLGAKRKPAGAHHHRVAHRVPHALLPAAHPRPSCASRTDRRRHCLRRRRHLNHRQYRPDGPVPAGRVPVGAGSAVRRAQLLRVAPARAAPAVVGQGSTVRVRHRAQPRATRALPGHASTSSPCCSSCSTSR